MSPHPLALAVSNWLTNEDLLARAQQVGEELDALVADALGRTEPTAETAARLTEAVRQLDLLPQSLVANYPGPTWTRYYETARRALTARAVVVFGRAEGARIAKPLEHEPLAPSGGRLGSLFR